MKDLRIHLQSGGGGAISSDNVGYVHNAFVERVVCTRESTAGGYPMIGCVAKGSGVDGLTFRDVELINPHGMGFELNAQGDGPSRAGVSRLLLSSVTVRNPGSGQPGTNFAPAISLDGFETAPRIENFLITGCPGTAIELIEVTDALVTDGLFQGCAGALVVASNVRPVLRPHLRALRVRGQVGTGAISIASAQDALIESCDLESTFIYNGPAPRTRIWNTRATNSETFAIFNGGGGGGGASVDVKGGYFESAGAPILMDPGSAGSSVVGATLKNTGQPAPWVYNPSGGVVANGNVLVTSTGVTSIGTGL